MVVIMTFAVGTDKKKKDNHFDLMNINCLTPTGPGASLAVRVRVRNTEYHIVITLDLAQL